MERKALRARTRAERAMRAEAEAAAARSQDSKSLKGEDDVPTNAAVHSAEAAAATSVTDTPPRAARDLLSDSDSGDSIEETFTCFLCGWDNFGPPELLEEERICPSCKANIEEIEDIERAKGRS